ncbi:MAG: abortive infection family protein [Patescibacteria group bacterium]
MLIMKISTKTLQFLRDLITGDSGDTEYKSGPQLVEFFNNFGFKDEYGKGFPSRWYYTENKLRTLNNTNNMKKCVEAYFHPINFIEKKEKLNTLVQRLNEYLEFDGYKLQTYQKKAKILELKEPLVGGTELEKLNSDFISKELEKCEVKIANGDYDGAVTNARTLLEQVLIYIGKNTNPGRSLDHKGDLNRLYKIIKKDLNLSPENITDKSLKEVLSGLISIVNGLSALRNQLSDAHGKVSTTYITERHHAILIVNCAKTVTEFLVSSYKKQYEA